MELLRNLIQTLSLNHTFFYHFLLSLVLFFLSKKLLFEPYIVAMDQRSALTKGRRAGLKDLDLKIEQKKELYEKKAKETHKKFQSVFNSLKEDVLSDFESKNLKQKEEQKKWLKEQRADLKTWLNKQNDFLEKELSQLSTALLDKIKS